MSPIDKLVTGNIELLPEKYLPPHHAGLDEYHADIGIIGGSGVYDTTLLTNAKDYNIKTPYGETSSPITIGVLGDKRVAFIARHGKKHTITPHDVNNRANMWAFRMLGIQVVLGVSAVGSLREDIKPGDIVLPDQFFDRTQGRASTYFQKSKIPDENSERVYHVSAADPFCAETRETIGESAKNLAIKYHDGGKLIVINGPRFSSKAESEVFRGWGMDIIGMTTYPENMLAKELGMCYASMSVVSDYDVWREETEEVSMAGVHASVADSIEDTKIVLSHTIQAIGLKLNKSCPDHSSLEGACATSD